MKFPAVNHQKLIYSVSALVPAAGYQPEAASVCRLQLWSVKLIWKQFLTQLKHPEMYLWRSARLMNYIILNVSMCTCNSMKYEDETSPEAIVAKESANGGVSGGGGGCMKSPCCTETIEAIQIQTISCFKHHLHFYHRNHDNKHLLTSAKT